MGGYDAKRSAQRYLSVTDTRKRLFNLQTKMR